jgi:hypothetical protein
MSKLKTYLSSNGVIHLPSSMDEIMEPLKPDVKELREMSSRSCFICKQIQGYKNPFPGICQKCLDNSITINCGACNLTTLGHKDDYVCYKCAKDFK